MSGTSADAIDVALVTFEPRPTLVATLSSPFQQTLRDSIIALCRQGHDEIERMGALDRELGRLFAQAVIKLLDCTSGHPPVRAIGCHGQTIRHRPTGHAPFTLQIGDPNTIAELTGITTVADFRRRDVAAGGEGAPLAPAFHQFAFGCSDRSRAIVNIGGMANLTVLEPYSAPRGYDTGPGNALMDAWTERHRGWRFDKGGAWAASGQVDGRLLAKLLSHPFFARPAPKSTGRESFDMHWLERVLQTVEEPAPEDVQATLLELSAITISQAILTEPVTPSAVYVCGGGTRNDELMGRLSSLLVPLPVQTTATLGVDPDWVEAAAFAWLARRTLAGLAGNAPEVTGAAGERILGGIYQP